ncbi:MAG: hypothetical protein KGJ89_02175 [Patescibacteria group bacterium]|nr:hypothetical protein [Patescibacteria group bacterium]MDE2015684.1 hypothetical protein [Patescibacteria group bacterium]MDE2226741.1 hypothetical protein [Patescibacteria group bacterium]
MKSFFTGRMITALIIVAVFGVSLLIFYSLQNKSEPPAPSEPAVATFTIRHVIIGSSVEGRPIEAFTYLPSSEPDTFNPLKSGSGKTNLLFVGGMHGGYEWNSVLLAYQVMDYLNTNPEIIPANLTVTVIPDLNPDGVFKIIGKEGRFSVADVPIGVPEAPGRVNAHEVDLNRNFDCNWQPNGVWQGKTVSAGTAPFSEPESAALRDFILKNNFAAAVFWHSQANAVYASECNNGILPQTLEIMNAYSRASGYQAVRSFNAYKVTGDSEGWLASIGIPAITVEMSTHETIEWDKNLAGVKALLDYYRR